MAIIKSDSNNYDKYIWDIDTENNVDTWVPVINNNVIQHRVIETYREHNVALSNVDSGGNMRCKKVGRIVQIIFGNLKKSATGRHTIATLPTLFRPIDTTYVHVNDLTKVSNNYIQPYLIITSDGQIQFDYAPNACWGSGTYISALP